MPEKSFELIFGSGPLALATLRALLKRGKIVKMVNRSGKRPADIPTGVEVLGGMPTRATLPARSSKAQP
jgi:hypothetical protein